MLNLKLQTQSIASLYYRKIKKNHHHSYLIIETNKQKNNNKISKCKCSNKNLQIECNLQKINQLIMLHVIRNTPQHQCLSALEQHIFIIYHKNFFKTHYNITNTPT